MTLQLALIILILLLLAYIIYLHVRLARNNLYLESTVRRLSGIEKSWTSEEMVRFMRELKKVSYFSSFFTDRLFEEEPTGFLLGNLKDSRIFIHYTREEDVAGEILRNGFMFADSFYKTALPVTGDRLDLLVKHNNRKSFGDFLIVICISNDLYDHYNSEISLRELKEVSVENILTEKAPSRNENSDVMYLLPNKFVKGFINHRTGEIKPNPEFNPGYNSILFEKNLDTFTGRKIS